MVLVWYVVKNKNVYNSLLQPMIKASLLVFSNVCCIGEEIRQSIKVWLIVNKWVFITDSKAFITDSKSTMSISKIAFGCK